METECVLKNGCYFSKSAKSKEKTGFYEKDMLAVIRTILFMQVFRIFPSNSISDIMKSGEIGYSNESDIKHHAIELHEAIELLDSLLGSGFSKVVSHPLLKWYYEYDKSWKYYPFNAHLKFPSADDFVKLRKFVNASCCEYSQTTHFMLSSNLDNRIPLQGRQKSL